MQDATNNLNGLISRLETMQTQFKSSGVNGRTNLSESLVSEFSSLFHEFVSAVKSTKHLGGSLNLNELNVDGVQKLAPTPPRAIRWQYNGNCSDRPSNAKCRTGGTGF